MQKSSFKVYNASAGSGKTYTLVKEYLRIILESEDVFMFQKILAVTFTNKAATEMKSRLVDKLKLYAKGEVKNDDMFLTIMKETKLEKKLIVSRSKAILDAVLKNYTAFSITTIDSFTHKIIRSFAYDLGLSLNFDVEMDPTKLLSEAVDLLISKIGIDENLTKVLVDFSLEKADEDKAWDITRELNQFSKLLLNEDDAREFKTLSDKSLEDFYKLRQKVLNSLIKVENYLKQLANEVFRLVDECNLQKSDFSNRGAYLTYFERLFKLRYVKESELNFNILDAIFTGEKSLYSQKASLQTRMLLDRMYNDFEGLYLQSKNFYIQYIGAYTLAKLALKSMIPLAVLNNINTELTNLKEENNLRLISEFNHLISDKIKDEPAPFIYERIGHRFAHYFIDEMQDTSVLQWENLSPLIDNVLAQSGSSLMLVGDGKQAIYRWRGGRAEQFIKLGTEGIESGFPIEKTILNLDTNYRSYSEIIEFTNHFFKFVAEKYIHNDLYKHLYIEGNKQLKNAKEGGCVTLTFLGEDNEEKELRYAKKVLERVYDLEQKGFTRDEICILVRTKKDGGLIANYLTDNGVGIVSSDSLLISNSKRVKFITNFVQAILYPKDQEAIFNFLYFLSEHFGLENKHQFLKELSALSFTEIIEGLTAYGVHFELSKFERLPLYEKLEYVVSVFKLIETSDAYVQFFLDFVLEKQQKGLDLLEFLEYWEFQKDKLSMSINTGTNKVQIMTIHKSKGLEFPVVIFPCDVNIYKQIDPKVWLDNLPIPYSTSKFNKLLLSYSEDLKTINSQGAEIYQRVQEELELDNFNLLYVALTRPIEQLHIITEGKDTKRTYSEVFRTYRDYRKQVSQISLDFEVSLEGEEVYGKLKRISKPETKEEPANNLEQFISVSIDEHTVELLPSNSRYWDSERGEAIAYGNKIHELLSKITYADDIDKVLNQCEKQGELSVTESVAMRKMLTEVVNHNDLKAYYHNKSYLVYNEREMLSKWGSLFIADRLVFDGQKVIVIEYKTGEKLYKHSLQISNYAAILQDMGYEVKAKILVYLDDVVSTIIVQ